MTVNGSEIQRKKPAVAHVAVPFLRSTETFIYDRIKHHQDYTPFVLTDEPAINLDLFPFKPIYSLADKNLLARKGHNVLRRMQGHQYKKTPRLRKLSFSVD